MSGAAEGLRPGQAEIQANISKPQTETVRGHLKAAAKLTVDRIKTYFQREPKTRNPDDELKSIAAGQTDNSEPARKTWTKEEGEAAWSIDAIRKASGVAKRAKDSTDEEPNTGQTPEHNPAPQPTQEIVQFQDGQMALDITGQKGARFDLNAGKYSPGGDHENEALIKTKSGNKYLITRNEDMTMMIVNIGASREKGKLVAYSAKDPDAKLPALEFGKAWEVPGLFNTSEVTDLQLKYKQAPHGQGGDRQVDAPDPFKAHKKLIEELRQKKTVGGGTNAAAS